MSTKPEPGAPSSLEQRLFQASMQDQESVTSQGASLRKLPDGVHTRDLVIHTDDRGEVMEMMDLRWQFTDDPLVFAYYFSIRPGWAKGWGMHRKHQDRYCLLRGEARLVLYDSRENSPTHGLISEIYLTEKRPQLINIPEGIWHADENICDREVLVVNFPSIPYDHADPDKFRLPLHTDLIPYKFAPSVRGY